MSNQNTNIKINSISSLILQIATILQGLILPRLILSTFGSNINGLVSSINQFLSFFSVLEGGITGVLLAALYGPVAKRNNKKISEIICAANKFLKKLAFGFLAYTIILSIVYPFTTSKFSWIFTSSLVLIISITMFIQYYFTIMPQMLIRADNKVYVYNVVCLVFIILNVGLTFVCIRLFPEIHLIKFLSALAYIIQPVIMNHYTRKHFVIDKSVNADENIIKNRWNGFGINIANIITSNTDVIVLTLFSNLVTVSIYTIYYSIVNSLKNLIMSIGYGYQSLTGQQIANHETDKLNHYFNQYEFVIFNISGIAFSACISLIVPFIMIYTTGVKDANYQQPLFAFLICLALYVLSIREPYIVMTYNAGLFKETQNYAYIEAILNIVISIILVKAFGLIGVAIGTVISALYRYIATLLFLQKNVLNRRVWDSIKKLLIYMIPFIISLAYGYHLINQQLSIIQWVIQAIIFTCISICCHLIIDAIFYRDQLKSLRH